MHASAYDSGLTDAVGVERLDGLTYDERLRLERARERLRRAAATTARIAGNGALPTRWAVPSFDIEDLLDACRELTAAQKDFWDLCSRLVGQADGPPAA